MLFLAKKLAFKNPPSLKFHDRTDINMYIGCYFNLLQNFGYAHGVEKVNFAILDHQKTMTFKKRLWINQNLITLSDWGRSLCCRFFALY